MYFTRNNYLEGKRGKNKKTDFIKIYKSTLENSQWINISELPFDGDNYSTTLP
jgi:hypothetical protein